MLPLSAPFPSGFGSTNVATPPQSNVVPGQVQAGVVAPSSQPTPNNQTNAAAPPPGSASQPDTDAQGNNTETPTRGEYARQQAKAEQAESQKSTTQSQATQNSAAFYRATGLTPRYNQINLPAALRQYIDNSLQSQQPQRNQHEAVAENQQRQFQANHLQQEKGLQTQRAVTSAPIYNSAQEKAIAFAANRISPQKRAEIQYRRNQTNIVDSPTTMRNRLALHLYSDNRLQTFLPPAMVEHRPIHISA